MNDLLTDLRDYSLISNVTGGYDLHHPNLTSRAADEIERLRKLILDASQLAGSGLLDEACELLHAEVYPATDEEPNQ